MQEKTGNSGLNDPDTIEFVERFASSGQFRTFFKEGMALVEETADYLDGAGREDVKALPRAVSLLYASESMRLTTRLMQIASWLLLQRAVNEGEMTREQASEEKRKVSLDTLAPNTEDPCYLDLPDGLVRLVDQSLSLQRRVRRLDALLYGKIRPTRRANDVHGQVDKLAQAFSRI